MDTTNRPTLFTGKERDAESGLDYFGARYYGSALGRFASPDKPFADQHVANPQSWNLYAYTRNNPLRFVDDDGQVVHESRDTIYYTVSGATANDALDSANHHFSGDLAGMTNSSLTFHYDIAHTAARNDDGSITVDATVKGGDSLVIDLHQTVELPKWDGYDKATPEEQKAWDQSTGQLKAHEAEHESINRAGADALDSALPGTSATATGKSPGPTAAAADNKVKSAVNDKAASNQQATNDKNQHLDACTSHGTKACN
jgi:RHS repeat-associated protein